jgi:2-amino-4-hydroxy-6-hydroxymethyldihydropteridine pyrophosphokinase
MPTVYLALGSNLGDRLTALQSAISALKAVAQISAFSKVYETAPAYVVDQPDFFNAAVRIQTELTPIELLDYVKQAEIELGRVSSMRYGPRKIDIDLLHYEHVTLNDTRLTLPHPRIAERSFVLLPLADIAPELILPGQHLSVAELAQAFRNNDDIRETSFQLHSEMHIA